MIGENLLDVVTGKDPDRPNEIYAQISESRVGRCIRTADYKYSVYAPGKNGSAFADSRVYADDFLYDLRKDPDELHNLIDREDYRDIKMNLREKLLNWIEKAEGYRPEILE